MIRTAWVFMLGTWWTLVYGTQMILMTLFRSRNASCICDRNPRRWAERILKAARCPVTVVGVENIDRKSPQIVVANHVSWFDVFVLVGHLPGSCRFVAKKELGRIPIFGRAIRMCGHVMVDRADRGAAIESLERAARQIRSDNSSIILFPEGTRSRNGELQRFKKGAFVLAIQAGVPVVPVAILGTHRIMPKGAWRIRPGPIEIRIGEPISVVGLTHSDRDDLLRKAYDTVGELLAHDEEKLQVTTQKVAPTADAD